MDGTLGSPAAAATGPVGRSSSSQQRRSGQRERGLQGLRPERRRGEKEDVRD